MNVFCSRSKTKLIPDDYSDEPVIVEKKTEKLRSVAGIYLGFIESSGCLTVKARAVLLRFRKEHQHGRA